MRWPELTGMMVALSKFQMSNWNAICRMEMSLGIQKHKWPFYHTNFFPCNPLVVLTRMSRLISVGISFLTHWEPKTLFGGSSFVLRLYHLLDKSFFHFLLIVHVEFVVLRPKSEEESITYALLHFRLSLEFISWLSSFVCSFLIELCGTLHFKVERVFQCTGRG